MTHVAEILQYLFAQQPTVTEEQRLDQAQRDQTWYYYERLRAMAQRGVRMHGSYDTLQVAKRFAAVDRRNNKLVSF